MDGTVQEHDMADIEDMHEGAETEQDKETSDLDEEHDSGTDDEATAEASVDGRYIYALCSFRVYLFLYFLLLFGYSFFILFNIIIFILILKANDKWR